MFDHISIGDLVTIKDRFSLNKEKELMIVIRKSKGFNNTYNFYLMDSFLNKKKFHFSPDNPYKNIEKVL